MAINVNKKNHIKIAPNNGTISTDCSKLSNPTLACLGAA